MAPSRHDLILSSELFQRSKNLAVYIVNKELGIKQRKDRTGEKLHELCKEMRYKHEPVFDGICNRLNLNRENMDESSQAVMVEVFSDGCNFGRVVSLYTFCLTLCEFSYQNDLSDQMEIICKNTSLAVYSHMDWFENQGSWDGFLDYFTTPEDKIWKGVVITTVGLGAVAGLLYCNS